jgi:hypothetical protein
MLVLSPGAVVTCRQTADVLWAVIRQEVDGSWRLHGRLTDERGRSAYTMRLAGEGDITVIRSAPQYEPGETIERGRQTLTVISDNGDDLTCEVGEASRPVISEGVQVASVCLPGGNKMTLTKGDLMAEAIGALK